MEDNKKLVLTSGVTILITTLLVLGGVNLLGDKTYFCEDRGIIMECESLSSYYGLPNGKCWNSEVGNKLCRSGWINDYTINDEVDYPSSNEESQGISSDGLPIKYLCHSDKTCERIQ